MHSLRENRIIRLRFRSGVLLVALCFGSTIALLPSVHAWENACSHPHITNNAISLLNPSLASPPSNYFIELQQYQPQMDAGATAEDEPAAAVVNCNGSANLGHFAADT